MATRWAENLKQQYEVESSTEKIAAYRQKECILYGFALLAYTLGEWDDDAAQSVCKLVVLFRTSFLCASINVAATDDMLRVESRVAEMMSRRITELIAKVETIGSNSVLTALTGEELFIQELTVGAAGKVTDILQLCSAQWIQTFSTMFPVRLQELYSHWYWEEKNCILFRPKEAKNRKVLFVARFDESGALHCYKVPFCDWELPYQEILDKLDNYDRFVQKESLLDVLQVLTKFEDKNFLHPLKSPKGMITIELPRFQLAFCLNSNQKFESVEHKGYILAINQQFDDFLTRHSRYLVLELQDKSDTARPKLRMLLPVGSMREDSEGMVDITIPDEADSLVVVACYDVHRRLKTLETETISARLQLAAICTRAGTNVPCKRLQMTGAEAAVQMLRACRFTHHATTACPRILATCFTHQQTHNCSQTLKRIPLPTRPPSSSTGFSRFFRHPRRHQSHHRSAVGPRGRRQWCLKLKAFGGIQVVAPEHRMSLELKRFELDKDDEVFTEILDEILDNGQYIDVLDECDASAGNGFHYQKTQYDQKEEWVPEDWSLEMLYQEKLHAETITHIIESKARSNFEGIDDDVVSQIRNSGRIYGLEDEVCVTAHTDECERELEVEEKVQEQQNLEVAHCSPAQEKTWNYAEILRVQSIEELDGVVRVYALVSFIRQWIYPKTFADLAWSTTHIFGTENFFSTVLQAKNEDQMNEYLRFIDVVL
ncbi:hypothetical protein JG687_00000855, partial [Phytophthora cactorum]